MKDENVFSGIKHRGPNIYETHQVVQNETKLGSAFEPCAKAEPIPILSLFRGRTYSTFVVFLVLVLVAESELFMYTLWLCC